MMVNFSATMTSSYDDVSLDFLNECDPADPIKNQGDRFKICEDDILGRHLVATEQIKANQVILREEALIWGPFQITAPVCLGCGKLLEAETAHPCSRCGWPMCNILCQESPAHIPECQYTLNKGNKISITNFIYPHPNYQCITVLRCLYQKENNKNIWDKLMKLESHCNARKRNGKYESERVTISDFIRKFFKLENQFSEEEILKICGIVQVNGHEVPLSEPPYVAIYENTSLLEHSCKANCSKSFTSDGDMIIISRSHIQPGEHLSICYADSLWGTANRRHFLNETKFFPCHCQRCQDPTEFGTYFSALKCQFQECNGFVLPATFMCPSNDDDNWNCNRCDRKISSTAAQNILDRIGRDLNAMQKGDIESCKLFLEYYGKLLHYNHYYLTDVRLAFSQMIGQQDENGLGLISDEDLDTKIKMCKDIIDILKIINPAEIRVRGVQLFELHAALMEFGKRRAAQNPENLPNILCESKHILEESILLLKHEPDVMPEGKICFQAKQNLAELNNLLRLIIVTNDIPTM